MRRALQLVLWAGAGAAFWWACSDTRFRNAEGFLTGEACLPIAAGASLVILGAGLTRRWRAFALWMALAVVGQAVALQMIDAGPAIRYQHYRPPTVLLERHPLLLWLLGFQTTLVLGGLRSVWADLSAWLRRTYRIWQMAAVVAAFVLASAPVSREVPAYLVEMVFAALVQAVNLGNVILAAWAFPGDALSIVRRKTRSLLDPPDSAGASGAGGVDRFALAAALWVLVVAATLNVAAYERHPHVPDEVVYLYHARYLAEWRLTLPAPPAPAAINVDLMYYEPDRWFSPVPPGWPFLLAVGAFFGLPWLVNPVLAGLNVLLAYLFVREVYDRRTARMTVLLLCVSPWHVFMAMNFMTHTSTLTAALGGAFAVARARRTGRARWGLAGGIAAGVVGLIRPLEGLVTAALLGLWATGIGGRRLRLPVLVAFGLGCLLVSSAVLPYNRLLTGDPTKFPIMAYTDKYYGPKTNAFGFGPERGLGWPLDPYPGHGPLDALVNTNLNVFSLNVELLGWSTGSLILIALLVCSGRLRGSDYLMLAAIAAVAGIHAFYWYSGGPDFGARYWYLILVPCLVLTARGIAWLGQACGGEAEGAGARVLLGVMVLCALTLVDYFPWRAIDKYHHYLGMRPDIRELARQHGFGRSLILVRGNRHPDYASAAAYNPVDLRGNAPVYAWDRNPQVRAEALRAYPDRPVWVVEGPTLTNGGFKVVLGPLPAAKLLVHAGEEPRVK